MAGNLKIRDDHLDHIKVTIAKTIEDRPIGWFVDLTHNAANDPRVRDVRKRVRWDLLFAAGLTSWCCDNLYAYLNDDHIDSALRRVMVDINLKEYA